MASPANFVSNGRLQVLQEPVDASQDGVDIILVPGTGTAPPENWPFASRKWLGTLPGSGAGARILAYKYASPLTGTKPSWESILMLGYDLLQQLSDEQFRSASDPTANKPILMVCHSLGGVIVKQALCVANKQFPRYGPTVNAIAGILFLSTPHRYGDKTTSLTRFRDILEATSGKPFKIPNANVEEEGAVLIDLADRFEGISFRTPILSVYELRETKNNSTPLRSKYQFVSREACLTHAPLETVIGLNLDHHETCLFTKSRGAEGLTELNKFIHNTMLDAKHLVALRLKDLTNCSMMLMVLEEYQYATTSAYSPTMIELQELTEQPSNRATEGTSSSEFELVHPVPTYAETQKRLHLPCFLLNTHAANEEFCGREDVLKRLAAELLPSKNAVTASNTSLRQFALCGFGGIGKTEIAREFARRHKDSFDAVFWVVADEVAKLDHHYQQISLALGLENPSECKSQVVSRETVKGWLSNPQKHLSGSDEVVQPGQARSEATWLLVFDNADDPMMLADYWPQGSGSILITSRDPLAKSIFTRTPSGLDLGPLTRQEILYLFHHLTTAFDDPEEDTARQISDAFGGVPLAISQMAGIIRRQDLTLSEFFELYKDHEEHASLYETKFDTNLVTYRHSLSTVWAFEKLKPQARQLLELISFLDPDAIAEDLLMQAWVEVLSNNGPPFKKSQYIEARADLLQSSLVQRDKSRQQISVHRIVQDAIFATMDIAKKRSIFGKIVRVLWAEWPSAMPKPSKEPELPQPKSNGGRLNIGRWPVCAASYPHVLKMHQLWPAIADPSEATRLHFAKLLNEAAWYQKERGWTKNFDGFFETARKIGEASAHADRDSLLADIYFCLGSIAMDASDFDTSRIYKERSFDLVSQICKSLGTADERLYLAYAERGISRIQDERYEEGEADLKEALRIRKALGNYVPRSGEANLSWALLAQGKLEECNALLLESLAGRERSLGKDDRESVRTGLILYALGNLRAAQGQWNESFEYHQRAWRQIRATVGDKDFYTATITHKIAEHLTRQCRSEEAIDMFNMALNIWSVDPNARKNEIARTTFFKGKVFEATGKAQKASISLKVASRLRKEIVDDDRDVSSLTTRDFDGIVSFWAR
ncbi:Tetratricopeptide repeat domain-containing protein [Colletotrichum higginsianum IMI 349063]|uniref:Tetratricopeptide repeat domain-containing protein n=1 Tax=Colletotrichum higginsianum (strain IMI 349063) TaxID=759273 RepID=A0A1B7YQM4_COLHI|nr:Tetratricopeptide repeat domain-containing protein [Colletotrichum higginsianum IMI 349063]OBR14340.1 Tetratricopeptide repeat domain-containing protein [Colletotrichum higginsianum IMI 349063]